MRGRPKAAKPHPLELPAKHNNLDGALPYRRAHRRGLLLEYLVLLVSDSFLALALSLDFAFPSLRHVGSSYECIPI